MYPPPASEAAHAAPIAPSPAAGTVAIETAASPGARWLFAPVVTSRNRPHSRSAEERENVGFYS